MKKQIFTDIETKRFLSKAFRCNRMAVWRALNFESNNERAQRMRSLAMQRGGRLSHDYVPNCDETTHDTAARTMTQRFGEHIVLVVDYKIATASVYVDGALQGSYQNMSMADFMQLQYEAEQMVNRLNG